MISSYGNAVQNIETGGDVMVDASVFSVSQLMMLARAAHAHRATLLLKNGPFRVEDALAVQRAGRGHVQYVHSNAA